MTSTNNISLQADPSEFEMPYGKHGGRPLCEIPTQYLRWVYRDWNFALLPELQRAIEAYLGIPADPEIRAGTPEAQAFNPTTGSRQPTTPRDALDQIVDRQSRPAWGASGGPSSGLGGSAAGVRGRAGDPGIVGGDTHQGAECPGNLIN